MNSTFRLLAHPAPRLNWTILCAPVACSASRFRDFEADDIARALICGLKLLRDGIGENDFNVIFTAGPKVRHFYFQIIPRGGTEYRANMEGGFELSTGISVITVDPRAAAEALRARSKVGPSPPREENRRKHVCLFCSRKTPSSLFFVRSDGSIYVPQESQSFEAAAHFWRNCDSTKITANYDLVRDLAKFNQSPPSEPDDAVRCFANLTPALVFDGDENTVLLSLAKPQEYGVELPDLQLKEVACFVRAFQFLEQAAEHRNLTLVAFFNSGPSAAGSVLCPHGQCWFLRDPPTTLVQIPEGQPNRECCAVCDMLKEEELVII
jgi:galactose-1-phosphate uridylyltransferase